MNSLIFFVYPGPMGSEENQFSTLGAGNFYCVYDLFLSRWLESSELF
jgi:hypothetical protein